MKRTIIFIVSLISLMFLLTACNTSNKDKMQGTWVADNYFAKETLGREITIKEHNITVNDDNIPDFNKVKYYNFEDKDEQKNIRFYEDKPNSDMFDKSMPDQEGMLSFDDNGNMIIDTKDAGKLKFKKK